MVEKNSSEGQSEFDEELYGLEKAVASAWETLANQSADEVVKRSQCMLGDTSNSYLIRFLGEDYTIKPNEKIILTSAEKPFFNLFKIGIILHYLVHAKNLPLANKLISFRELWGGNEYYYAFNNRVLKPLTSHFGDKPELLMKAGTALNGERIDKGEYGLTIPALPRVPLTVLLWTGDEELEPSANILFDTSANDQMETEALVWLSIAAVSELKKNKE